MKEIKYDLIEWMETMSDSFLSESSKNKWEDILNHFHSDEFRVIITDEGVNRWIAKISDDNRIKYVSLGR